MPNNPDEKISYEFVEIDCDYFKTMGVKLIEGRNYSAKFSTDTSDAIIVNAEFIKKFNLRNNLDETLPWLNERRIIGIVENFHIRGLYEKIPPAAFYLSQNISWQIAVKINSANIHETINFIKNKWSRFNTDEIFSYNFLDEKFDRLYKQEQNFAKIIGSFSILAIFITCMGILGLMLLTVEQRTKEIGIRKVMGASISAIVNLLTKEYLIYILISILIAGPFAFYFMSKWLENFAYKISISAFEFTLSVILILVVTFLTIGSQAIKVALLNPVESLRNE